MKVKVIVAAVAALALTGCSSDEVLTTSRVEGVENAAAGQVAGEDSVAVLFASSAKARTRATHEKSAELLGGKFVVYGEKYKSGKRTALFDNYNVTYSAGTAGSTASNTDDWDYVGQTSRKGATQGLRYWDFSSERYQFVAVSGLGDGEMISNTSDGMRIRVNDATHLTSLYVSDRVTATPEAQAATTTTPKTNAYKEVVELQFRRLGAQMRVGFYETVPGYAVKDLVFYYIGAPSGSKQCGVGTAFPQSGTYTVSYDDATNVAHAKFVGAKNTMAFSNTFGALAYTSALSQAGDAAKPYISADGTPVAVADNSFLSVEKSTATFARGTYTIDGEAGVESDYKPILPNESNSLQMQLRVDYTLVALDGSGEEIEVRDAHVTVPAKYLQWKPNHAYTYLFKISDKSNGYTGEGGGGDIDPDTGGRKPDPDNGGGDNDPEVDPNNPGTVIPPYVPDPDYPGDKEIPNPDYDPDQPAGPDNPETIPNPDVPLVPNPEYPTGPEGDQHDPSNEVPEVDDPLNPKELFPITFDAVVEEMDESTPVVDREIRD